MVPEDIPFTRGASHASLSCNLHTLMLLHTLILLQGFAWDDWILPRALHGTGYRVDPFAGCATSPEFVCPFRPCGQCG